jgi:hypothetical protein
MIIYRRDLNIGAAEEIMLAAKIANWHVDKIP